jgi:hypothetical protein
VQGWIGTIYSGDCTTAKNLTVFLHLMINILSTILLSASNYCMVCLLPRSGGSSIHVACSNVFPLQLETKSMKPTPKVSGSTLAFQACGISGF